jgi:hypothetical protein
VRLASFDVNGKIEDGTVIWTALRIMDDTIYRKAGSDG